MEKELEGLYQQRQKAQSQLDAVIGAIQLMEQLISLTQQVEAENKPEKPEEPTNAS